MGLKDEKRKIRANRKVREGSRIENNKWAGGIFGKGTVGIDGASGISGGKGECPRVLISA